MLSSARHMSVYALFLAALTCSAPATADERSVCIEKAAPGTEMTRFDEEAGRAFLVSKTLAPEELATFIPSISACMSDLGDRWAVSLFRAAELAGYKDEPDIIPFHQGERWAKGYVAEYLRSKRELTAWPVIDSRVIPVPKSAP